MTSSAAAARGKVTVRWLFTTALEIRRVLATVSLIPEAYSRKALRPSLSASAVGEPENVVAAFPPRAAPARQLPPTFGSGLPFGLISTSDDPLPSAAEGHGPASL